MNDDKQLTEEIVRQMESMLEGMIKTFLMQKYKIDTADMTQEETIEMIKKIMEVGGFKEFEAEFELPNIDTQINIKYPMNIIQKQIEEDELNDLKKYFQVEMPLSNFTDYYTFGEAIDYMTVVQDAKFSRYDWGDNEYIQIKKDRQRKQKLVKFIGKKKTDYLPSTEDMFGDDWYEWEDK